MSIIPYICPLLLCLCTVFLIWAAEAAHRPFKGTTEWILRAAHPPRMSPGTDSSGKLAGLDAVPIVIVTLIYFVIMYLASGGVDFQNPISVMTFVSAGLTMPVNYFIAKLLTGKFNSSVFAAVLCLADAWFLSGASLNQAAGLFAATLYVLFLIIYINRPFFMIPGGIFLGCAVFFANGNVIFALLGVIISIVLSILQGSAKPFIVNLIFGIVVPAIVYCVPNYILNGKITFSPGFHFDGVALSFVCFAALLVAVITHIFRDKSFVALFVSFGFIISAAAAFTAAVPLPVLMVFPAVYLGNIVFSRGKTAVKAAVWSFAAVMLICLLVRLSVCLFPENDITAALAQYLAAYTL